MKVGGRNLRVCSILVLASPESFAWFVNSDVTFDYNNKARAWSFTVTGTVETAWNGKGDSERCLSV